MKKFASILMIAALAAFMVAPAAMACDGAKAEKADAKASCSSKAKVTTADATKTEAKATMAGSSCSKSADKANATKAGANCTKGAKASADCAKVCTGAKTTTADATLPNGHPMLSVSDALKCGEAKVAFMNVNKMTCGSCVSHVNKTVGSMDGVCAVDVNLEKASATIVFHPTKVKADDMVAAINKAGYEASMKTECTEDMKAVFGEDWSSEKCASVCVNMANAKESCTKKAETSET